MKLVEVKKNEIYCDSSIVARKFELQHASIVRTIEKLIQDLSELRVFSKHPKIMKEDRVYRGNPYTAYLMNRPFFSLLVPKLKGKKALEWQIKFNDAFYEMEQQLFQLEKNKYDREWIDVRHKGKKTRIEETDIIKKFVEYAAKQGSKNSKFYYVHITNATYKALGLMVQRKPKLRDIMNIYEISELLLAERIAKNSIKRYMDLGRNYKDIYESVKDDLVNFANGLRIE